MARDPLAAPAPTRSDSKTPHRLALGAGLPRTRERAPLTHRPDIAPPAFRKTAGSSSRTPPLKKWYKKTSPPHAETPPRGIPLALTEKRDRGGSPKKRGGSRSPGRSRTVSARRPVSAGPVN